MNERWSNEWQLRMSGINTKLDSTRQGQGRRQRSENERRLPSTQCKLSPHHARVNQEDVRQNLLIQIREQSMEIMGSDSKCDINNIYEGLAGCPRMGPKVEWAFDTCATCSYMWERTGPFQSRLCLWSEYLTEKFLLGSRSRPTYWSKHLDTRQI